MSRTKYETELGRIDTTYTRSLDTDIQRIKTAISGASEFSVIGVGSGGSFTVASLLCNLHEAYTGRVSRPSTPLELICNPTLASASPVFLISAEGKNPDIIEALKRSRMHSARPIHIITNRSSNPLIDCANRLTGISTHSFQIPEKDGFLATNSLLFNSSLIARAYQELDQNETQLPTTTAGLQLGEQSISDWIELAKPFAHEAVRRGAVLVTFSPFLRPIAADLESKLAESALLHCQLADLRSFAHGRHLWLAERPDDCAIIALIEPSLQELWRRTVTLIPESIPTLTMPLGSAAPNNLLAGLIAQMNLIAEIARCSCRDPGQPSVPQFGSELHYMNISDLIPSPASRQDYGEQSKYEVIGARWPSIRHQGSMRRALEEFRESLEKQIFRAIVFDYDGTLCSSQRNDIPPSERIIAQLHHLIETDVFVGIASGRGGSVQEELRKSLPKDCWPRVHLGLYNAGCVVDLATDPPESVQTSEFLSHVTRIVRRLKMLGVPIERIRPTHPYQVSVRFHEGVQTESNWFVISDALRQAGLGLASVVRSKHSIDVLGHGVNKSHLVAHLIQEFRIDPYEILTMGDQGAWPGNDSSLLEHQFSLSVDLPSRRLDRGWKLAPAHKRDVDATLWYLQCLRLEGDGQFRIELSKADEEDNQ